MERIILKAPIGFIYTNGINYGQIIYLAINANKENWKLITESEYEAILERQNTEILLYQNN